MGPRTTRLITITIIIAIVHDPDKDEELLMSSAESREGMDIGKEGRSEEYMGSNSGIISIVECLDVVVIAVKGWS